MVCTRFHGVRGEDEEDRLRDRPQLHRSAKLTRMCSLAVAAQLLLDRDRDWWWLAPHDMDVLPDALRTIVSEDRAQVPQPSSPRSLRRIRRQRLRAAMEM